MVVSRSPLAGACEHHNGPSSVTKAQTTVKPIAVIVKVLWGVNVLYLIDWMGLF